MLISSAAPSLVRTEPKGVIFALRRNEEDPEAHTRAVNASAVETEQSTGIVASTLSHEKSSKHPMTDTSTLGVDGKHKVDENGEVALYVPPPRDRDEGQPFVQRNLGQGESPYLSIIVDTQQLVRKAPDINTCFSRAQQGRQRGG